MRQIERKPLPMTRGKGITEDIRRLKDETESVLLDTSAGSVYVLARRAGLKVTVRKEGEGVRVWRVFDDVEDVPKQMPAEVAPQIVPVDDKQAKLAALRELMAGAGQGKIAEDVPEWTLCDKPEYDAERGENIFYEIGPKGKRREVRREVVF